MNRIFIVSICCLLMGSDSLFGQLTVETFEGPKPWSNLDINSHENQFQFAIVTDRTGGHRPGVFEDGVRKLNLLQPEFVMSVGDLIEGYTEDMDELTRQWKEFNGFIDELTMPFFYVPGNHDVSNKVMEDLWVKKYGKAYFHFIYKDVLFLCLNSEDRWFEGAQGNMSSTQADYAVEVLNKYPNVRWTLLFMHKPLWNQQNQPSWKRIEDILANRKHTVFTGHVHYYAKYDRNNGKYFTLGTTGGGSALRGPQLGEFDHVSWITMTDNGPIMANLQLEGVWDENVSTENSRQFAQGIWTNNPLQIEPIYVEGSDFESGNCRIKITNDKDVPMEVQFNEGFNWNLKCFFDKDKIEVAPNSVEFVNLEMISRKTKSLEELKPLKINASIKYTGNDMPKLSVPVNFNVRPEPKMWLNQLVGTPKIDGKLDDWKELPFRIKSENEKDATGMFTIGYDDKNLYIAAKIMDDQIWADTSASLWNQDNFAFVVNAEPLVKSASDNGNGWYRQSFFIQQSPAVGNLPSKTTTSDAAHKYGKSVCVAHDGYYVFEASVSLAYIKEVQGDNWKNIRINALIRDADKGEEEYQSWFYQPDWRGNENTIGSGMFFKE